MAITDIARTLRSAIMLPAVAKNFLKMSGFTMGGERGLVVIDLEEEDVIATPSTPLP
jgi:hypothetical protein